MKRRVWLLAGVVSILPCLCLFARPALTQTEHKSRFSHPATITNTYIPLSQIRQEVFEGKEDGKAVRVIRTRKTTKKTFALNGKRISPLVLEDREFENGKLKEVTLDYFAQDDAGSVYYLGEDVDNYLDGKVVGHGGAWTYGKAGAHLGVMFPARVKIGDKYQSENVPGVTVEDDEVVSTSETITALGKTFTNCVRIKETLSDGGVEYKVFAPGIGMVLDDSLKLISRKNAQ